MFCKAHDWQINKTKQNKQDSQNVFYLYAIFYER